MITADELRHILDYDPDTGIFRWRRKISKKTVVGRQAGTTNDQGYIVICICRRDYRAHQLAFLYMEGRWPADKMDHKNLIRSDNSWKNLREANSLQNTGNTKRPRHNKSGVKGVYWDVSRQKWHAQISVNDRSTTLGRFADIQDAQAAYERAAIARFGEFARMD